MRRLVTGAFCLWLVGLGAPVVNAALRPPTPLDVCLLASPLFTMNGRERTTLVAEANAIWQPLGVQLRWAVAPDDGCERIILVKPDGEALPGEAAEKSALGWVPFVEGRARRIIFLRLDRSRRLMAALSPGSRPAEFDSHLFATFIGRSLAHELGHVLLNSRVHPSTGLMRARYAPRDILRTRAHAYTLGADEMAALRVLLEGRDTVARTP